MLERVKTILTVDWQKSAMARARVSEAIEETLDEGLRVPTPLTFQGQGQRGISARLSTLRGGGLNLGASS
jgi:hypothetical protein